MHVRGGLRLKFILLISGILLAVFGLIAFFMAHNARTSLNNNVNEGSKAFASLATKPAGDAYVLYKDSGTARIAIEFDKFLGLNSNVSNMTVVGLDGSVLYTRNAHKGTAVSADKASSFDPSFVTNARGEIVQIVQPYFDDTGQHGYALVYDISTAEVEQAIARQEEDIIIFALLGLVLTAVATYEFMNRFFLLPIQRVSQMSSIIASGYYSQQIVLSSRDEIGQLAGSVNRMASSLKANIEQLQQLDKLKNEFIMITSHNLRTPLTIIEGNLSLLHDKSLSDEVASMLSAVETSARELNSFSEQMLTIASIEVGHSHGSFEPLKLGDILLPLEQQFGPQATAKGIELAFDHSHDDAAFQGNTRQLTAAFANLLDNALKFTKQGKVSVTTEAETNKLKVSIADTGIGIKTEELSKIFTKFHRGTDTLQYNYEGTGIGLYAAKLIIEQHRGTITVVSTEGKGSTFTVELPIGSSASSSPTTQEAKS